MIKVSKFARESGSHLADSIANFKIPENPPKDKEKKWFLSGDMTFVFFYDLYCIIMFYSEIFISMVIKM